MAKKTMRVVRATGERMLSEHIEPLPVQLSKDELLARGTSLVRLRDEERKHGLEFEQAKHKHKEAQGRIDEERERLEQAIRDHREPRPVKVQSWARYDQGRMESIRTDTGELIDERALLAAEMQEELELDAPKADH